MADKSFFWSGQIKGEQVEKTREKFSRWFKNDFLVVSLEQRGSFEKEVEIIVKANTAGMNHFYSFDGETNKYRLFVPRRKWLDEHGYTHFITSVGGDIIISRGPLVPRKGI